MQPFNPMLLVKTAFIAAAAAAVTAFCLPALAQTGNFPGKPVTIVTAFPAGSGPDAMLRQVSEKLSRL